MSLNRFNDYVIIRKLLIGCLQVSNTFLCLQITKELESIVRRKTLFCWIFSDYLLNYIWVMF